ncbi:uncharacterized protein LOC135373608 [Ornithodoros turicata]|uniref:uncharacterized protein LOC135373608 n=1 Tax=Ornithodoros turicata TaxID=34597 RepID=UPI003139FCC4
MVPIVILLLWSSTVTASPRGKANSDKFLLCGEKFSVITVSKAAFLGSRLFEACGKQIMTDFQYPASLIQKGITLACFAIRACYDKYKTVKDEDMKKFKNQIASCVPVVFISIGNLNKHYVKNTTMDYENLIHAVKDCFQDNDLVPEKPEIALAMVRWYRATFFR